MAKRQTRKSVSLNRAVYEAVKLAARQQDKSIAHLVEDALRTAGIKLPATTHMLLSDVQRAALNKPPLKTLP